MVQESREGSARQPFVRASSKSLVVFVTESNKEKDVNVQIQVQTQINV